ncbi:peptide/nickel transport system ATP-binding protein [Rhizobiales bacterium GAS188]|nr:peptide/nickel transport system ATP-binding protein [Rhizobiales bacterium GAS188]
MSPAQTSAAAMSPGSMSPGSMSPGSMSPGSMSPALDIAGLHIALPTPAGLLRAVRGVDLRIERGETLCLVGESGSGKSLTALAAMGLLPEAAICEAARLDLLGEAMRLADEPRWQALRGDRVAMIFQDPMSALNPAWSVGEQMVEGIRVHRPGLSRRMALGRAAELLEICGIDRPALRLAQHPHLLSGGMRQRVVIAMALMSEPALLIADEPTTALDATVQAQILDLLAQLQRQFSLSLLLITHDLGLAERYARRVAVMYAGEIVETGPTDDIFARPLHPYTRALLDCRPGAGRLGAIAGTVPSLVVPPAGCAFLARCGFASDACRQPVALRVYPAHRAARCVLPPEALPARLPTPPLRHVPPKGADMAVALQGVGVRFASRIGLLGPRHVTQALRGIDLNIPRGSVCGIVGESGSGKSTLARVILGLQPGDGSVALLDRSLSSFTRRTLARVVQPVFQDPYSSLNPRRRIGAIIRLPLDVHDIGARRERAEAVQQMMARCGLPDRLAGAFPAALSGGQRQRVAIATALIMRPDIVVCDEPTSALDVSVQAQILTLLRELRVELGLTYVFISHDLTVVRSLADQVVVMRAGEVVEQGEADAVFAAPRHPYTAALLAASGL